MTEILLQCVLGSTCVALFAFAAREEDLREGSWGAASGVLWLAAWLLLGGGLLLVLVGQVALYAVMAVRLARRRPLRGAP